MVEELRLGQENGIVSSVRNQLDQRYRENLEGNLDLIRTNLPQVVTDAERLFDALHRDGIFSYVVAAGADDEISPSSFLFTLASGHYTEQIQKQIDTSPSKMMYVELYERYSGFMKRDRETEGKIAFEENLTSKEKAAEDLSFIFDQAFDNLKELRRLDSPEVFDTLS